MASTLTTQRPDALSAEVAALRAEIVALRRQVSALAAAEARQQKPTVALLQRLLPALAGAFGSNAWRTTDALAHPNLRPLLHGWTARRLGIFLGSRADGVVVDGYRLDMIGREGHVALWRVVGVLPE